MNTTNGITVSGIISSVETMGGRDGPGLRFVVFMQGCPLRCVYCHNPETWDLSKGTEYIVPDLFEKILRCKPYFGNRGGITVSGGEPLMQQDFVTELFKYCKAENIHTALDTSGAVINEYTPALLSVCDLVLLDIKFTSEEDYLCYTGGSLNLTLDFLVLCCQFSKNVIVRHVVVPGINDTEEDIRLLDKICSAYPCATDIELLPFSDLCLEKYEQLKIPFPLVGTPPLSPERLKTLCEIEKRE